MPSLSGLEIQTQRLLLKPTGLEYAEEVFANFTPEVTTYMFPAPAKNIDETRAFLRGAKKSSEDGTELVVVVLHGATGEFLGHGGLHHIDTRTPELGIWVKKAAHGHGYGREAITGLTGWAMQNLDFDYLVYPVDRRNLPSRRIPEALGGVIEAEYTMTNASGNLLEILEYRIHRSTLVAREKDKP